MYNFGKYTLSEHFSQEKADFITYNVKSQHPVSAGIPDSFRTLRDDKFGDFIFETVLRVNDDQAARIEEYVRGVEAQLTVYLEKHLPTKRVCFILKRDEYSRLKLRIAVSYEEMIHVGKYFDEAVGNIFGAVHRILGQNWNFTRDIAICSKSYEAVHDPKIYGEAA